MVSMSVSDTCVMEKRETLKRENWGAGFSSGDLTGELGGVLIPSEAGSNIEGLKVSSSHSKALPV